MIVVSDQRSVAHGLRLFLVKGRWPLATDIQLSGRNSYSSITAATASLPVTSGLSIRTTRPLHCTRILSVRVISGGSVSVKPMGDPCSMGESR